MVSGMASAGGGLPASSSRRGASRSLWAIKPVPRTQPMRAPTMVVARAQASGDLRADFAPTDLPLIFTGAGAVMDATRDVNPRLWERYLTMVLDGLRASAATPLPVGPLTAEQQFLLTPPDRRGPGRC